MSSTLKPNSAHYVSGVMRLCAIWSSRNELGLPSPRPGMPNDFFLVLHNTVVSGKQDRMSRKLIACIISLRKILCALTASWTVWWTLLHIQSNKAGPPNPTSKTLNTCKAMQTKMQALQEKKSCRKARVAPNDNACLPIFSLVPQTKPAPYRGTTSFNFLQCKT